MSLKELHDSCIKRHYVVQEIAWNDCLEYLKAHGDAFPSTGSYSTNLALQEESLMRVQFYTICALLAVYLTICLKTTQTEMYPTFISTMMMMMMIMCDHLRSRVEFKIALLRKGLEELYIILYKIIVYIFQINCIYISNKI